MNSSNQYHYQRLWPQPLVGVVSTGLALLLLATCWGDLPRQATSLRGWAGIGDAVLALALALGIVASYQFPIHVNYKTKVCLASVPLYLLAVLLPPPLAATAAGLGTLASEMSRRSRANNPWSTVLTTSARWVPVVYLGALVAHLRGPDTLHLAVLIAAAGILAAGDALTIPLALGPLTGDRPLRLVVAVARDGYLMEGAQYLLGFIRLVAE